MSTGFNGMPFFNTNPIDDKIDCAVTSVTRQDQQDWVSGQGCQTRRY